MYLPLNDWGARFLMEGWQNGGGDPFGSCHFLVARTGTIVVPLEVPADRAFAVDVEARAEGAATGTLSLDVAINGRSFGDMRLNIGGAAPTRQVFVTPPGVRLWRRGYNRVTLSRAEAPAGVGVIVYVLRLGPQR